MKPIPVETIPRYFKNFIFSELKFIFDDEHLQFKKLEQVISNLYTSVYNNKNYRLGFDTMRRIVFTFLHFNNISGTHKSYSVIFAANEIAAKKLICFMEELHIELNTFEQLSETDIEVFETSLLQAYKQ